MYFDHVSEKIKVGNQVLLPSHFVHRLMGKGVLILTNIMSKSLRSAITDVGFDGVKCPIFNHLSSRMALLRKLSVLGYDSGSDARFAN
jgi:hypothetical protein